MRKKSYKGRVVKRYLPMVSMKAALEEKKAIVKANDEDKGEKVKRHKDRNAGLE